MRNFIWLFVFYPFYSVKVIYKELRFVIGKGVLLHMKLYSALYYFFFYPFLRHAYERHKAGISGVELTVGDTPLYSFDAIIQTLPHSKKDKFCDLGCGKGHLVIFMAQVYKIPSLGIDIMPTYIKHAKKLTQLYRLRNVDFIKDNFFNADLSEVTILYITATCLSQETRTRLAHFLATQLPKGAHIISTTYPIVHSKFEQISTFKTEFSWGPGTIYIQQKQI